VDLFSFDDDNKVTGLAKKKVVEPVVEKIKEVKKEMSDLEKELNETQDRLLSILTIKDIETAIRKSSIVKRG